MHVCVHGYGCVRMYLCMHGRVCGWVCMYVGVSVCMRATVCAWVGWCGCGHVSV